MFPLKLHNFSLFVIVVLAGNFHIALAGCENVVSVSSNWTGGYTVALNIPVNSDVSQWTLDLTFSASITSLQVWNAASSTANNIAFKLTNLSYNGAQKGGTTLTGVGFNVAYPTSNPFPTINSILFNGLNVCSGSQVTSAPSTAPTAATTTTTSTTTTSTTTTKPSTAATSTTCSSIAVVTNFWPGGYTMNLNIPFSTTVTSWTVGITFSAAITSLSIWNAGSSSSNNIVFTLTNMAYNGNQNGGSVYNGVGFNVAYPSTNPMPIVTAVTVNGLNVCTGGTVAASTAAPTTLATSTSSPTTSSSTITSITTAVPGTNNTKYNYAEVLYKSLLFYAAERSGYLPDNDIPYRGNSALRDAGANGEDLTGGYYDAGDHVKFGFPMAYTATVLSWSVIDWQLGYASAGQLARAQKTIKWATDYFLKAHISSNGATVRFYGQVGDGNVDHSYWGRPEDMTMARPSFYIDPSKPGSDLAGETAAALAAASIVFSSVDPTYAANCLSAAKQLYTFANQYRGTYDTSITNAANFYKSWSGYGDELAWAAIWLYRATNTSAYLTDALSHYSNFGLSRLPGSFSWDDKTAGVQVLLARISTDPAYKSAVQAFCDSNLYQLPKTPKGLVFISQWGALRYAANSAMICLMAADLNINTVAYRKFAQNQIHYALGDTGRSFVCGFGTNPPVSPHHRSSSCPNRPSSCDWNNFNSAGPNPQTLWGALVGGPDANDVYADVRSDFQKNEVATDYNAGFQAAVAGLQKLAAQGIVP